MKKDLFNKWFDRLDISIEEQIILFEDEQVQHIQVEDNVYFYNKNDDEIYIFGSLKHYNNTRD